MHKPSLRPVSLLASSAALLLLVGAGCISINSGGSSSAGSPNSDGGIFKSANKGDLWTQKAAVATTTAEKRAINNVNVITIVQDPSTNPADAGVVYLGTVENGLLYTYDGGESWQQAAQLSRGRVSSIAVDPKDKCTIYATFEFKLLKSTDCSRTWDVSYTETRRQGVNTTSVVVDHYDPRIVWVANASGDLQRSDDYGATWVPIKSFEHPIGKMLLNSGDSRMLYVATTDDGVWRTTDSGKTWKNLRDNYDSFEGASEFYDMSVGVSDPKTIVIANKYGLLRSVDNGEKWSAIELLTPPNTTRIYSVVVDPKDTNGLYYGTANTFYKSPNAGVNWVPKQLPTTRAATAMLVDRTNQNVIYLGVTRFSK